MTIDEYERWKAAFDANPCKMEIEHETGDLLVKALAMVLGSCRASTDPRCTRAAERYDVLLLVLNRLQQKEAHGNSSTENDGPSPGEPD